VAYVWPILTFPPSFDFCISPQSHPSVPLSTPPKNKEENHPPDWKQMQECIFDQSSGDQKNMQEYIFDQSGGKAIPKI
jgi:hypothetical protein